MEKIAGLIDWRAEKGFDLWLFKRFGLLKVTNDKQAGKVIEGLKNMFENQMKRKHGEGWQLLSFENAEIMKYIQYHMPKKFRI
jgi:hypothetical protein